jgi:hypothetical protein
MHVKSADETVVLKLRIPRELKERLDRELKAGTDRVPWGAHSAFIVALLRAYWERGDRATF